MVESLCCNVGVPFELEFHAFNLSSVLLRCEHHHPSEGVQEKWTTGASSRFNHPPRPRARPLPHLPLHSTLPHPFHSLLFLLRLPPRPHPFHLPLEHSHQIPLPKQLLFPHPLRLLILVSLMSASAQLGHLELAQWVDSFVIKSCIDLQQDHVIAASGYECKVWKHGESVEIV
ncbi:unnamed protein product [Sphenostylis stenocarpa]|uniref:Uncharacterized protein n=1 Tax=Sphenostylis stenocarpa TaxID=92480 RepID=A0AA86RXB2_9FABA|nr:unnamed protein product [Sphenostylis stenocarpa]